MSRHIVGYHITDLHLSLRPPAGRSSEPDWKLAQARPLRQVRELVAQQPAPVFLTGDLTHHWNEPAAVISLALEELPDDLYGIAGNHDLPNHDLAQEDRSAYGALVRAGKIQHLDYHTPLVLDGLTVYGYSYGQTITPPSQPHSLQLQVALVHAYIWRGTAGHAQAGPHEHLSRRLASLSGYDVALFGDNHHGFHWSNDYLQINNGGCLIRRRRDEKHLQPCLGVIYHSGVVERLPLDGSADCWSDAPEPPEPRVFPATAEFVAGLQGLAEQDQRAVPDYNAALLRYVDAERVDATVRAVLLEAMENK